MTTDKLSVQSLIEICYQHGIKKVIFSPGSRNAPLVIGFMQHKGFETLVIADERVAAFHALGQAIASKTPTVICCTSGTAALNYGPAIAEAYYQQVPMLILTADRPVEWIDMGIGQSMRQKDVFHNYVKKSFQFVQEATHKDDLWYNERIANAAINLCTSTVPGPVHINLPFRESLYNQIKVTPKRHPILKVVMPKVDDTAPLDSDLIEIWKTSSKRLILIGQTQPNEILSELIESLIAQNEVVVLAETTSNIRAQETIDCIDRVLPLIDNTEKYRPDLVLTIGGAIVSKRIKSFIKDAKPQHHWYVGLDEPKDTFQRLSRHLMMQPVTTLRLLVKQNGLVSSNFLKDWKKVKEKAQVLHSQFLAQTDYCDLKVFEIILRELPEAAIVHFASSTPIRYSQLFSELQSKHIVQCNRGVSGIDGSTSTALGYSGCSDKLNILITGDISFFYDSNAFWYNNRPTNLKVILINNGGGNIFKYISGPETTQQLHVFEASHQLNARPIAELHSLVYSIVSSLEQLISALPQFYKENNNEIGLLEIDTRKATNAEILREYFSYLSR